MTPREELSDLFEDILTSGAGFMRKVDRIREILKTHELVPIDNTPFDPERCGWKLVCMIPVGYHKDRDGRLHYSIIHSARRRRKNENRKYGWVARMETRITELESVLKGAGTLIESAMTGEQCPNCDNSGCYAEPGRDGDPEPQQCEFCYTVPWSRFNVERLRKRIRLLLKVRT